ncbi:unnamed protein product, partial [Ectocarpus sp. 12 AP-2014]
MSSYIDRIGCRCLLDPVLKGEKVADIPSWSSRLIPDDDELPADPSASPVVIVDGHYITYR